MTNKQTSDQQLKDDVTELKVTMNEVVKPALIDIKNTLASQSYVPMATYVTDVTKLRKDINDLQIEMQLAQPVVSFFKVLSSRFVQIVVVAVILIVIWSLATQVPKWLGVSL